MKKYGFLLILFLTSIAFGWDCVDQNVPWNWFVRTDGNDANEGHSYQTGLQTIRHAIGRATNGGKNIYVYDGIYNETGVDLNTPRIKLIGSGVSNVNIVASSGDGLKISQPYCSIKSLSVSATGSGDVNGISIKSAYATLEDVNGSGTNRGICIDGRSDSGMGVRNAHLLNCRGIGGRLGIAAYHANYGKIENCIGEGIINGTTTAADAYGVYFETGVLWSIKNLRGLGDNVTEADSNDQNIGGIYIKNLGGNINQLYGWAQSGGAVSTGNRFYGIRISQTNYQYSPVRISDVSGVANGGGGKGYGFYASGNADMSGVILTNGAFNGGYDYDAPPYYYEGTDVATDTGNATEVYLHGCVLAFNSISGNVLEGSSNFFSAIQTAGEAAIVAQNVPTDPCVVAYFALAKIQRDANDTTTLAAIAAAKTAADANFTAVRSDVCDVNHFIIEQVDDLKGRLTAERAGYLDKLDVSGVLAHSDASAVYKADVTNLDTTVSSRAIAGDAMDLTADAVDDVWDEDVDISHQIVGSAGKRLDDAGSAGDPWSASLPGSYSAGTAGKIVGDNLNATVSSRAPASTALSNATWTDARAGHLDKLDVNGTLAHSDTSAVYKADVTNLDTTVSSRLASSSYTEPNNTGIAAIQTEVAGLDGAPMKGTDDAAPASTALSNATWTDARAGHLDKLDVNGTLAHSDTSAVYKADVTNLDTTVSSRLASSSYTEPNNTGIAAIQNTTTLIYEIIVDANGNITLILADSNELQNLISDSKLPAQIKGYDAAALAQFFITDTAKTYGNDAIPGSVAYEIVESVDVSAGDINGVSDWTESEKAEFKTVFGITGTGTPNDVPSAGILYELWLTPGIGGFPE